MDRSPSWHNYVHHDGSRNYVSELYPRFGDNVTLRLRAGLSAPIRRAIVRTFPDGEQVFTLMAETEASDTARWWTAVIPINQPTVHYRFILECDDGVWWYSANGITTYDPLDNTDFQILANYHSPDWLQTAVFYQIFPDRFANGQPDQVPTTIELGDQTLRPQITPWGKKPDPSTPFPFVFYGGDLPGIIQHLDHLHDLGVNAIYLNPIFTAYSNHKYDVVDYENVDPHLGGNKALIALRQALSQRNMHYILDIVPNHCGYWHPWFQKARQDATAPEADFFTFTNHPDDYLCWLGVWLLPKLNYQSQALRQRIYEHDDSAFQRWLKPPFAADGWRVDVANMLGRQGETQLGQEVSAGIRQAVKSKNPDAYLIGETFFDPTLQVQGDRWDGVMNYSGLTLPLWYWLSGYRRGAHGFKGEVVSPTAWPTEALADSWQSRLASMPWAIALQQYNLLGSHDVPRIRTVVGENDALHRLAVTILLTFPGVPGLYYGDEIGMVDSPELEARGCMIWDKDQWDHDLLHFYRDLIALRKQSATLQRGGFQILAVEPDTIAYQRELADEHIVVVAHRGALPRQQRPLCVTQGNIPDGTQFVEHFSGQTITVKEGRLPLPEQPQGATIWRTHG